MTHWLDLLREAVASSPSDGGRALILGDPAGRAATVCERAAMTVVRVAVPHGSATRRFDRDGEDLVVRAEPTALPFADGTFDLVVAHATLEFSHDDRGVVAEVVRLLRPGGSLVVRLPRAGRLTGLDALNLYRYTREVTDRGQIPVESLPIGWRRHYGRDDLKAVFGNPGLRTERIASGGLGLGEAGYVPALVATRALFPRPRLVTRLRGVYERIGDLDERLPGPATWAITLRRTRDAGNRQHS